MQTIADRVGVSRMTVSNAFSRPDQLSAELRLQILEVAQTLGYVGPDPVARALARGTTGAVGVLLTDSLREAFSDEVATRFLSAIVDELSPTGLALTLLTAHEQGDAAPARDVGLDGAIIYSCRPQSTARDWLVRRKLPLVLVDQDPAAGVHSVNVDDRGGARAAASHLLELGHRRIALVMPEAIGGDPQSSGPLPHPQRQRLAGWRDVLGPAGVEPREVQVASSRVDVGELGLSDGPNRPTAVLCFSDLIALQVIAAASEAGLAIPEDLSVVGFDDSPSASRSQPPLTTVRQDVERKGRLAAKALTAAIDANRAGLVLDGEHLLLDTELVVRQSTAPPRAGRIGRWRR